MKRLIVACTAVFFGAVAFAGIKPRKAVVSVRQSDGTELTLRHVGDERFSCFETLDGYTVKKNEKGDYCYVVGLAKSDLVLSTAIAHNADKRGEEEIARLRAAKKTDAVIALLSETEDGVPKRFTGVQGMRAIGSASTAPLSSKGTPRVPVVLVQFKDLRFTVSETNELVNDFYDKFCNGTNSGKNYTGAGSAGAIKDYFIAQSDSLFMPDFQVIGPVTLDEGYAYYGRNEGVRKDVNINDFYAEAIEKAQAIESDWECFDNDEDGVIDMVFFIYAGEGENGVDDENTIWPKEVSGGGTINGVKYGAYACCNELYNSRCDGIGVMCHELSHALGLPDLYDTNYVMFGMDYWDVMDSGNYCFSGYCPCGYSSYEKDFMGWKELVVLDPDKPQRVILKPLSQGGEGYKIINKENENEYYTLENRQNSRWDSYIGRGNSSNRHHGMLITHVDYNATQWRQNQVNTNKSHQRLTLIPADGELYSFMYVETEEQRDEYMKSAAGDPYPGVKNVTELADDKAVVYTDAHYMNQPVRDIEEREDGTISFKYCITEKLATPVLKIEDSGTDCLVVWDNVSGAEEYKVEVSESQDFADYRSCYVENNEYRPIGDEERNDDATSLYIRVKACSASFLNSDFSDVLEWRVSEADGVSAVLCSSSVIALEGKTMSCSEPMRVYNVSGTLVHESGVNGKITLSTPGIYVVKAAHTLKKVVVK